jgi:uncharacterized DUF497 family protein
VFRDPFSITIRDPDHSKTETRFLDLETSHKGRLLTVAYTERGRKLRIISARLATRGERREYEEEGP